MKGVLPIAVIFSLNSLLFFGPSLASEYAELKWITHVMPEILQNFTLTSNNSECDNHINLYKNHLSNLTLWAVKILSPNGALTSTSYSFGSYDQCLGIDLPQHNFKGQYCLVSMAVKPNSTIYPDYYISSNETVHTKPGPFESAWSQLKRSPDKRIKRRDTIHWAICIPSTCRPFDLAESLREALEPALLKNGVVSRISVQPENCQVRKRQSISQLDFPTIIFIFILILLTLAVISVSLVHLCFSAPKHEKKLGHWIFKLSIITNVRALSDVKGCKELKCLSGMKLWSMIIIIYGHRLLILLYQNVLNPEEQEEKYGQFLETVNFNGAIVVNTFLLISGFLSYYKCLKEVEKKRKINPVLFILYRWLRVTPVYMAVIGLCALVLPISSGGPFWKSEGLLRYQNCRKNWWIHLLYINNYYHTEEECIIPGWYLAVDMQMFVLCSFIGYIAYRNIKLIAIVLGILTLLSIVIPAYVIYKGGYDAIIKFYLNYLPMYYREEDYVNTYTRTHMRATPYFIGMWTAIVHVKLKKIGFKFKNVHLHIGSCIALLITVGTLLFAWIFFIPGYDAGPIVNSAYGSLSKLLWSVAIAWIILAEASTGFGILSNILKHNLYVPLSKLTLCVLIVHTPLQQYLSLKQRLPGYIEFSSTIWMTCGDILLSYILALILHLVVEAPLANFQLSLFAKIIKTK